MDVAAAPRPKGGLRLGAAAFSGPTGASAGPHLLDSALSPSFFIVSTMLDGGQTAGSQLAFAAP